MKLSCQGIEHLSRRSVDIYFSQATDGSLVRGVHVLLIHRRKEVNVLDLKSHLSKDSMPPKQKNIKKKRKKQRLTERASERRGLI